MTKKFFCNSKNSLKKNKAQGVLGYKEENSHQFMIIIQATPKQIQSYAYTKALQ
jgi:hypothetical protein